MGTEDVRYEHRRVGGGCGGEWVRVLSGARSEGVVGVVGACGDHERALILLAVGGRRKRWRDGAGQVPPVPWADRGIVEALTALSTL
jgi:hypothetical protein